MGVPENLTSKQHQVIQSWSDEDKEENLAADLLTPRQRKGVEQTGQEGSLKPAAAPSLGMPTASAVAASPVPPPSEGG
jgi:Spy/CpxP family protein refolding chaperone